MKNQKEILQKLQIESLNQMQEESKLAIHSSGEVMVLSPTGTGKTLAFLLPIIAEMDPENDQVQCLIIVPSRELAIQIEQVAREIGSGFKVNAVYGGRPVKKDKEDLKHLPAILIGTPGRVADHVRRGTFDAALVKTVVLDEFDKSLEVGFEEEMTEIVDELTGLQKKILTSATKGVEVPAFMEFSSPIVIDYLGEGVPELAIRSIISPTKDKIDTLYHALNHLDGQNGIVFLNFKDAIQRVSDYLYEKGVDHGCFYGGLDQIDRERALLKFRNGTHQILIATDLAARGIDIPALDFIVHYHLPLRAEEFTHRNGRTARMSEGGTAYVLHWEKEELPEFIPNMEEELLSDDKTRAESPWTTLMISGGRRDKISKGDIAGLFFKQGELKNDEVGIIELKNDCAFVAVKKKKVDQAIRYLDNSRVKKRKVRVTEV